MDVLETLDPLGKPRYEVIHPNSSTSYYVSKEINGFCFYEITVKNGQMPDVLKGSWTSPKSALAALQRYLDKRGKTARVEVKEKSKKYASRSESDSKDNLQ